MTVAILGGVFDPPHLRHVALAEGPGDQLGADRVLVLVAERPGHKGVVDAETCRRMAEFRAGAVRRGTAGRPSIHGGLPARRRVDRPYFVLGGDEWESFASWREPDEVRRLARIAVGARPGFEPPEGDVEVLRIEQRPISSSEVRARVAAGEPIDDLCPARRQAEIARLGLYRDSLSSSGRG